MQMMRSSEGSALSPADALVVDHYSSKQHWVEFNDDQCALQMVVIDGMSLRQTARLLGISAMTVQRRVKRGLNTIAKQLNAAQPDA